MPDPFAATPPPIPTKPAPRPTRAYTTLFWFLVVGQILATFTALMAVATLLATARPVVQWRVALTSPTPLFQITDADFACNSDTDCTVVVTDCGGCGESFAVNGAAAARLNREMQARCVSEPWRLLCQRKPEQASCVNGRCIIGPPVPISTELPHTAGWQTYRDEQYGLEFQYPTDWELKVEMERKISTLRSSLSLTSPETKRDLASNQQYGGIMGSDIKIRRYETLEELAAKRFEAVELDVATNANPKSLEELAAKVPPQRFIGYMTLGGRPAYRISDGDYIAFEVVLVEKDAHIYTISIYNSARPSHPKASVEKILSTFKFTQLPPSP